MGLDLSLWIPPTLRKQTRVWPIPELGRRGPVNKGDKSMSQGHRSQLQAPGGQMGASLHVKINKVDSDLQKRFEVAKIVINAIDQTDT